MMGRNNRDGSDNNKNKNPYRDDDNDDDDADDDDETANVAGPCQWPFLTFCNPQAKKTTASRKKNNDKKKEDKQRDLLGTPLPPTPVQVRRARANILAATGLEVEASLTRPSPTTTTTMTTTTTPTTTATWRTLQSQDQDEGPSIPPAGIHKGRTAEKEFHAKYELCELLGVGSTSTCHRSVLRNRQASSSSSLSPPLSFAKSFACKVIDKKRVGERFQGMLEQFYTEIEALSKLRHPHIIQLYDVYLAMDKIYIVMELMSGGELFDYVVSKGTLTEEEAAGIVRDVTSAIDYMHKKSIIHRDLKPENLLLTHKPKSPLDRLQVKIIDFGLSKLMMEDEPTPMARTFLGTRGYLAPEILQRREYSQSVDAWALGVIVFVLVCGCLPFDDDSQSVPTDEMVQKRFQLRFPPWAKNLSVSAKDLLSHLLDINPRTRFTAEQALAHEWVTGDKAPKANLLQSPGRLANATKSPGATRPATTSTAVTASKAAAARDHVNAMVEKRARVNNAATHHHYQYGQHAAAPRHAQLVRKVSI